MADLALTAASIVPGAGARVTTYTAGATITAGQSVYFDSATNTVKLASAAAVGSAAAIGTAVNGASSGQPVDVQLGGKLTTNSVLSKGVAYYVSNTAGGICPFADLVAGKFPTLIGVAESTTSLIVSPISVGVAL
jgi:hypothetical protein